MPVECASVASVAPTWFSRTPRDSILPAPRFKPEGFFVPGGWRAPYRTGWRQRCPRLRGSHKGARSTETRDWDLGFLQQHDHVANAEGPGTQGTVSSTPHFGYVCWGLAVGISVSLKLWVSVQLTAGFVDVSPFVASCHVAARALLLSSLCLLPFASWDAIPKSKGPWLAGLCTLPSPSVILSADVLGLGLTQMLLKLSTLSTALIIDTMSGHLRGQAIKQRLIGTAVVLCGVAVAAFSSGFGSITAVGPLVLLGVLGTAASGAGFVLQTRLSTLPASTSAALLAARGVTAEKEEATAAVVCQLISAGVQMLILIIVTSLGYTTLGALPMRWSDAPLWIFEGLQGAFFLRSMQTISKKMGLATTFTTSLCGQLVTAAAIDMVRVGGSPSLAQVVGLGLVICGALIGNAKTNRVSKLSTAPAKVVHLMAKPLVQHK